MLAGSTTAETFGQRSQVLCFNIVEGLIKEEKRKRKTSMQKYIV